MAQRQLDHGALGERSPAAEHLVQHDPDAVDVGGRRDPPAAGLLGGHVAGRADNRRRGAVGAALGQPGDPKVTYLDPPIGRDQDVAGLTSR